MSTVNSEHPTSTFNTAHRTACQCLQTYSKRPHVLASPDTLNSHNTKYTVYISHCINSATCKLKKNVNTPKFPGRFAVSAKQTKNQKNTYKKTILPLVLTTYRLSNWIFILHILLYSISGICSDSVYQWQTGWRQTMLTMPRKHTRSTTILLHSGPEKWHPGFNFAINFVRRKFLVLTVKNGKNRLTFTEDIAELTLQYQLFGPPAMFNIGLPVVLFIQYNDAAAFTWKLNNISDHHGCMSQGGCSPPSQAKSSFFGQMLNFSGISQKPKMKENIFLYLLNEKKQNSFRPARWSAQKPGFLLIITGCGVSRAKQFCRLATAVFWGAVKIYVLGKDGSAPLEKWPVRLCRPPPINQSISEYVTDRQTDRQTVGTFRTNKSDQAR